MAKRHIYFVDNKKIDLNSSEWEIIYSDGKWSDRGVNLYHRKKDNHFIAENWSNWQGEGDDISLLSREEAINWLFSQTQHPERVDDAFEKIGYKPESF